MNEESNSKFENLMFQLMTDLRESIKGSLIEQNEQTKQLLNAVQSNHDEIIDVVERRIQILHTEAQGWFDDIRADNEQIKEMLKDIKGKLN